VEIDKLSEKEKRCANEVKKKEIINKILENRTQDSNYSKDVLMKLQIQNIRGLDGSFTSKI
jgi:hypothetical protein